MQKKVPSKEGNHFECLYCFLHVQWNSIVSLDANPLIIVRHPSSPTGFLVKGLVLSFMCSVWVLY